MNIKIGDIELANRCMVCGGGGQVEMSEDTTIDCGECDAIGWHITDDGVNIAKFLDLIQYIPRNRQKPTTTSL